jgi:hypothetical protein
MGISQQQVNVSTRAVSVWLATGYFRWCWPFQVSCEVRKSVIGGEKRACQHYPHRGCRPVKKPLQPNFNIHLNVCYLKVGCSTMEKLIQSEIKTPSKFKDLKRRKLIQFTAILLHS